MDPRVGLGEVGEYARRVERLGFDTLHVPEMVHDPFVVAALALATTEHLRVRTAVALAFVRSPMATAIAAWDLAHLSGGRFDLGLGTQIRANIEDRYGMAFDRPVSRLADHVTAIRACFDAFETGEPLHHDGAFHRLTRLQPDFRPEPLADRRRPAIWLGGVGDQLVGLAGRLADGFVTHPTTSLPADLERRVLPALERAADQANRPRPLVVAAPMVATGSDPGAVAAARDAARHRLAFLYSTPAYRLTLEQLGRSDLGPQLRALIRADRWEDLGGVLDDDVLDRVVPTATHDDLADRLWEWYGSLVDGIALRPGDDDGVIRVVAALHHR